MATVDLPPGLRSTKFDEREREAAFLFHKLASEQVPGIVLTSRRTRAGYLKMVVTYPDGCVLREAVKAVVQISRVVRDQTGVLFIPD